jgi:hypothetical protein
MQNFSVKSAVPNVFVQVNDKTLLVPSMVLSTLSVCMFATFLPQLMPLWMAWSTGSRV